MARSACRAQPRSGAPELLRRFARVPTRAATRRRGGCEGRSLSKACRDCPCARAGSESRTSESVWTVTLIRRLATPSITRRWIVRGHGAHAHEAAVERAHRGRVGGSAGTATARRYASARARRRARGLRPCGLAAAVLAQLAVELRNCEAPASRSTSTLARGEVLVGRLRRTPGVASTTCTTARCACARLRRCGRHVAARASMSTLSTGSRAPGWVVLDRSTAGNQSEERSRTARREPPSSATQRERRA